MTATKRGRLWAALLRGNHYRGLAASGVESGTPRDRGGARCLRAGEAPEHGLGARGERAAERRLGIDAELLAAAGLASQLFLAELKEAGLAVGVDEGHVVFLLCQVIRCRRRSYIEA